MERISPGVFETTVNGVTTLYTKTGTFSDGSLMTDEKCDGYDFIKVGYEYFRRVGNEALPDTSEAGTLSEFTSGIGTISISNDNTFLSEL